MIWLFRTNDLRFRSGLVLQSGTLPVLRRCLPRFKETFGDCPMDLLTCYPRDTVESLGFRRVWDVREFAGTTQKLRLLAGMKKRYDLLVILTSNETVMRRWRLAALLLLAPKKVFAFNENADGYWVDWPSRGILWRHLVWRMDHAGLSLLRLVVGTLFRILLVPVVYLYLLGFLTAAYMRRGLRWAVGNRAKSGAG